MSLAKTGDWRHMVACLKLAVLRRCLVTPPSTADVRTAGNALDRTLHTESKNRRVVRQIGRPAVAALGAGLDVFFKSPLNPKPCYPRSCSYRTRICRVPCCSFNAPSVPCSRNIIPDWLAHGQFSPAAHFKYGLTQISAWSEVPNNRKVFKYIPRNGRPMPVLASTMTPFQLCLDLSPSHTHPLVSCLLGSWIPTHLVAQSSSSEPL